MAFPVHRPRRLRSSDALRALVRETRLSAADFVLPLFVKEGIASSVPVASMPGVEQSTLDDAVRAAVEAESLGLPAVLLFGIPAAKDEHAQGAWAADGVVQRAVSAIRKATSQLVVITDVCLCEYMSHGHCGLVHEGEVLNDETLELLAKTAVSHAAAGAHVVAPSDMMDGRVKVIREALDGSGHGDVPILAYAAKFASALYSPFRDAGESAPAFGDRRTYQMDGANAEEALREVALDIEEGADLVMVKPALGCGDIVWRVKERFGLPTWAYAVSGEYSMVKAAAERGWVDERAVALELMTGLRRAGADRVVTYWARDLARWLA
jgi:porphobilinogen synthase